jgi:hypothetical protein
MNELWEKYWVAISSTILSLIVLFAIIKSSRLIRRFPERKYIKVILLFFTITFIQLFIGPLLEYLIDPSNKLQGRDNITNITGCIYLLFEYLIYIYLLHKFIKSKHIRIYLKTTLAIIYPLGGILWFSQINIVQAISMFTITEALLLLFPCFYFFYEILTQPPILQLNKEPAFWIITGIIFLFICLIPVYFGLLIMGSIQPIQTIDYIGYSIIIALFLKGASCKPIQTG